MQQITLHHIGIKTFCVLYISLSFPVKHINSHSGQRINYHLDNVGQVINFHLGDLDLIPTETCDESLVLSKWYERYLVRNRIILLTPDIH